MKKLIITLIFISLINLTFAQDYTIVAVGEAEQEKDGFVVAQPTFLDSIVSQKKDYINEVAQIIRDDFHMYRHLFKVSDQLEALGNNVSYELWKSKNFSFVVLIDAKMNIENVFLTVKVYAVNKKLELLNVTKELPINNLRTFSHSLADEIYQKITGKESIFTKKILFLSDRTSLKNEVRKEVYIMDFDGQRVQRITYHNAMIISPAISPDNKKILFSMYDGRWRKSSQGVVHKVKNLNLFLYDMESRKTTKISDKNGINSGAIFTQDPNYIYLTLSLEKNADIYRMNLSTNETSRVTNHMSDDVDPHINNQGNLMTFLSGRPGKAMIYTMDPNVMEKDVKRISFVGRFNASPRFSPDGKEIVFSSWVDERFDIYKIDSDGTNLVRLTKNFGSNEEPMFSPDGQFIIFTSQRVISRKEAVQDIYIMNKEGEIVSKLTNNYGKCYTPRWTN